LYALGEVIYDEAAQVASIKRVVDRYVDAWRDLRLKHPDIDQSEFDNRLRIELSIALAERFVFIKLPAFREEHEWRVAKYRLPSDDIAFRERNGMLVPYVTIYALEVGSLSTKSTLARLGSKSLRIMRPWKRYALRNRQNRRS
jgi:hypothetical protein